MKSRRMRARAATRCLTECLAALDRLCEELVAPLELAQAVVRLRKRS